MTTFANTIDPLRIRKVLGRDDWLPPRPHGPSGWWFDSKLWTPETARRVLVTSDPDPDTGIEWIHASMSYPLSHQLPSYEDLVLLHRAAFGNRFAFQVFAPRSKHVNLAEVLHLWGRADGVNPLPDFGQYGII